MIKSKWQNDFSEQLFKAVAWSVFIGSLFYTDAALADVSGVPSTATTDASTVPTLDQALANLKTNIPSLMQLVTAFAYITGLYFVIEGVIELKIFGESRTMMSSERGLKKPLLHLFIGGFLIYLPSTIQMGIETLWNTPYPTAYLDSTANTTAWQLVVNNSFTILQLIGVVAFIRGLIMLTHLGGHGGQPGTFAKGMTHIIGGILCINMYDTVRMIGATLGLTGVLGNLS